MRRTWLQRYNLRLVTSAVNLGPWRFAAHLLHDVDEAVLALLFLTRHDHWRAWKGFDWDALSRLYDKGLIADPVNKAKSVAFTEEGLKRAEVLFQAMFTKPD